MDLIAYNPNDILVDYPENKFFKLSDAEYFANRRVSHSTIKNIDRSPAYLYYKATHPEPPTQAMALGSFVHALILEPDVALERFVPMPKINKRTNAGKDEAAAFAAEHAGKTILTQEQAQLGLMIADNLRKKKSVRELLDATTDTEVVIFFERGGIRCRAKLDAITHNGIIWDIKTTECASAEEFGRSVVKWSYHTQAEFYLHAANLTSSSFELFAFVPVEKEDNLDCQSLYVPQNVIEEARGVNEERLERISNCLETGYWPGYPETPQELIFPAWGFKKRGDY